MVVKIEIIFPVQGIHIFLLKINTNWMAVNCAAPVYNLRYRLYYVQTVKEIFVKM